jgi:virginiamycin A acetyltransferase
MTDKMTSRSVRPREIPMLGTLLFRAYALRSRRWRQFTRWLLDRCEGGSMFSVTLRRIFARYHGVTVGDYTHGGWMQPFHIDEGTTIGRYCSIAETARVLTHNHPLQTRSTSGLFFHPFFGMVSEHLVSPGRLQIGNDVWIGHNAVLLPSVNSVGDGAVIGAGSVVGRDVPPFAIVHGNPGRVVGYRFDAEQIAQLLEERWWDQPAERLRDRLQDFMEPLKHANAEAAAS